jgi:alpha-tubulin suppressor-like RCC1 family protein
VGEKHVCAAFAEPKVVRCSGADDRGQAAGAQPVLAGAAVTALAAGGHHTCAVLEDGGIQCWGGNEVGQLGDGTTTDSRVPVLVHGLPPALDVRAGASHTCARLRNKTVACWGGNAAHQLANGMLASSSKPAPVTGLVGVQELALAGDSACARLADGAVRCWGGNAWGQLGDGTTSAHDVPMPIKAAAARSE